MEYFGRFQLERLLGSGAMGDVYLAHMHSSVGVSKPCIIKRLKSNLQNVNQAAMRFADEMQILSKLHHRNIVNAFEFGECEGQKYVAMEFVDGMDLRDLLDFQQISGQTLEKRFAYYILLQVARGLNYLHSKETNGQLSIIHRDLAPHNILLSKTNEIKIADFGLAKSDLNLAQSTDGSIKGHVGYMSPEQAKGGTLTCASDVFSLGIITYELLSGESLFTLNNTGLGEALKQIASFSPATHIESSTKLTQSEKELLRELLAAEPEERLNPTSKLIHLFAEQLKPETPDVVETDFQQFVRAAIDKLKPYSEKPPGNDKASNISLLGNSQQQPAVSDESFNKFVQQKPELPLSLEDELKEVTAANKTITPEAEDKQIAGVVAAIAASHKKPSLLSRFSFKKTFKFLLIALILGIGIVVGLEEGFIPDFSKGLPKAPLSKFSKALGKENKGTTVYVDSLPSGAKIYINKKATGFYTPHNFSKLKTGIAYTVYLQKKGYQTYKNTFTLKAGENRTLVMTLVPKKKN